MITKSIGYQSSDGTIHGSLVLAQLAELKEILFPSGKEDEHIYTKLGNPHLTLDTFETDIAQLVLSNHERVIDILTMTPKSKPKGRKINGATRTRKPKRHEAEQFPLPMEDNPKPAA